MKFKERLLQGKLIKRYKRFFVDIKYENKTITAHCPNSGSMMGLLKPENTVWFTKVDDPKASYRTTEHQQLRSRATLSKVVIWGRSYDPLQ